MDLGRKTDAHWSIAADSFQTNFSESRQAKQSKAKQRSNQPAASHRSLPLVFKQRFLLSVPLLFQLPALYLSSKCQLWPVVRFKRAKRHTEVSPSLSFSLCQNTTLYLSIQGMITVRGSAAAELGEGRRILSRVSSLACVPFSLFSFIGLSSFLRFLRPAPSLLSEQRFRGPFLRRAGKSAKRAAACLS